MNKDVCDRLAAYEDTGLEPEDLKRAFNEDAVLKLAGQALGITPDRLRELAQADREKRIIVVPKDNNELFEKLKDLFFSDWAALRREQDG
jgi:hypothetical protein